MHTVLVVDDNPSDREGLRDLMDWGGLGLELVGFAANGEDGFDKAVRLRPDFILTDISMPVMDGIAMTQRIKDESIDAKIIFMSCHDEFDYARNAIDLEVHAYLLKPIKLDELAEAFAKLIALKDREDAQRAFEARLKRRIAESASVMQEQFIRDVLYGKYAEEAEVRERAEYLELSAHGAVYAVVILQVDRFEQVSAGLTMDARYAMMHGVQLLAEQYALDPISGFVTFQPHGSFVLVAFGGNADQEGEAFEAELIRRLTEAKWHINERLGISVTIGISEPSRRWTDMPTLREGAEYAAGSKFYSAGNVILMASELRAANRLTYSMPELQKDVALLVEQGDEDGIRAFVDGYYGSDARYPEKELRKLAMFIAFTIESLLLEKNENADNVFGQPSFGDQALKCETIVELREWLVQTLDGVRRYFLQKDGGRYEKMVRDIEDIIDEQYASIDNIEQVASQLYLSASYANVLFKQQRGQTIFDYLVSKRMEAAKLMLAESNDKIYEICEKSGYKSTTYFGTIFKQYAGLSPKEYRNKYYGGTASRRP